MENNCGHLMITRRTGESFLIGDDIEIEINGINGKVARVSIRCPKSIPVDRKEIYLRKRYEKLNGGFGK
jgi:carbon storage regulator